MKLIPVIALIATLSPNTSEAAHRFVCMAIEKALEATDEGLSDAAAGLAGTRSVGRIAVYANEAPQMVASFSTGDPLPEAVLDALAAMHGAATGAELIADIAPLLLENGLIIQEAMPQICPRSDYPDLARHEG
tara:strand:- start:331 stop:729 length:399 start_codon:yes stop_codon:yes gene_type:complete